MSESPQNVAAGQARKVLICEHDPSRTHQRPASRMLQWKIYHITVAELVNIAGGGFLIRCRSQQPILCRWVASRFKQRSVFQAPSE